MCRTRFSHWFILLHTTAFIAPRSISLKTAAIHPTSSISLPQLKAILPATRSCLLPPLQPVWPCPPPQPSGSFPAGTTPVAHSPGLDNWRSDRSSNRSSDSYIDGPSKNTSNPHSPGLDPWQSDGSIREGKGSSSSGVCNRETNNGQVSQGSNGSGTSSEG